MLAAPHRSPVRAGCVRVSDYHRAVPELRVATRDDIPAIAPMHLASWRATYTSITPPGFMDTVTLEGRIARWESAFTPPASATTETTVAVEGERILGVCSFGPRRVPEDPNAGEIYSLHISPDALRIGLGRMLLDDALARLRDRGFTSAFLWVLRDNHNARAFYEARGWSLTGEEHIDDRSDFGITDVRYSILQGKPDG
jgi:ribosomal protein S18 acetylase RimI-like enzyme